MAEKDHASNPEDQPTMRHRKVPCVLVVGGTEELVAATTRVANGESPAIGIEVCGAANAPSLAARLRPFALVLNQEIFDFDPEEFTALARDVHADLVVVKISRPNFLEHALRPSLRTAFRRFRNEVESGPVRKR